MNVKARLRTFLRPVVNPIWHRVWARIEARLRPIEARLDRLDALDAAWRTHSPAFLNAVGTVGAFGHKLAECRTDIDGLQNKLALARSDIERFGDRIEFSRREVLFEFAHGESAETRAAAAWRPSAKMTRPPQTE